MTRTTTDLLDGLNEQQREAVLATEGPVLVIAGAGSGKTRVLTHRIAHLVRHAGIPPEEIVAVTFTNKAAGEMRGRIEALLGGDPGGLRMGTFHSLCLRMLRVEAERLGYHRDFVVFDTADQTALMKEIVQEQRIDTDRYPPRALLHRISGVRNRHITDDQIRAALHEPFGDTLIRAWEAYRARLKALQGMDFDDLILNVLDLFRRHPDRAQHYRDRTTYLLVDEYQDTNAPQYVLVNSLAEATRNLCVVGDDAQSIYRFRGADIGNILRFSRDYPDACVVKLTRNYRSTGRILQAAGDVIRNNAGRIEKELWTENPEGDLIGWMLAPTDRDEAAFVAGRVLGHRRAGDHALEEMAVLYRTNAQSRLIEEAFMRDRIPYRIFGSVRFYDRKEIRDLLAYLRLIVNPADDVSLRRIVNVPARGIGKVTLGVIETLQQQAGGSLRDAVVAAIRDAPGSRHGRALAGLIALLDDLAERRDHGEATSGLIVHMVDRLGYEAWLRKSEPGDVESRIENIQQLVAAAQEREAAGSGSLQEFLDGASLVSDIESVQGDAGVSLMTLHCAKGLEFPVVFMTGMEENIFPHARSLAEDDPEEIEEERRLCYVGMTRAMRRLYLSAARERRAFGTYMTNLPSRFLEEISRDLVEDLSAARIPSRPAAAARWGASAGASRRAAAREAPLGEEDIYPDPDEAADGGLRVGMEVFHEQFGYGTIEQIEGRGDRQKATVRFSGLGRRKIMTRYANMRQAGS